MPLSLEKEELSENLHYESSLEIMMHNHDKDNAENSGEPEPLEDRIAAKIELLLKPLKESIDKLEQQWFDHTEEINKMRDENWKLKRRIKKVERQNKNLVDREKTLEDVKYVNNVIIQGLPEAAWETSEVCKQ